jgi:hypothetical protein
LTSIKRYQHEFGNVVLKEGFLSVEACSQRTYAWSLKALRPSLQLIVNGFDISDTLLCSALGRKDGKVYETLLELACESPVNETQPHPAMLKHVKPLARL